MHRTPCSDPIHHSPSPGAGGSPPHGASAACGTASAAACRSAHQPGRCRPGRPREDGGGTARAHAAVTETEEAAGDPETAAGDPETAGGRIG